MTAGSLVDERGRIWPDHSWELARRIGYRDPTLDLAAFCVRERGFIHIRPQESGVHIALHARRSADGNVELRVSDDGPGVPDAIAERIFEPFFSTKEAGEGTGLGLAISRSIAEAHGGKLTLERTASPGATFVLTLPPLGKRLDGRSLAGTEVST